MSDMASGILAGEVTRLALCLRMSRLDGVTVGFTGHDRAISVDGLVYWPKPGLLPSTVSNTASFSVDSMTIEGGLDAAILTAADLDLGRWRGAQLELFLCDWSMPEAGRVVLTLGVVGDAYRTGTTSSGRFGIEVLADRAALRMAGAPLVSPLCRAELGDGRCGVDMEGRSVLAAVVGGDGERLVLDTAIADAERFWHGRLRLLSGPATGIQRRIAGLAGDEVVLGEPIWGVDLAGSTVRLREGCDRRFSTCAERFDNAAAFDGEPHVPGNDAMVRYGEG